MQPLSSWIWHAKAGLVQSESRTSQVWMTAKGCCGGPSRDIETWIRSVAPDGSGTGLLRGAGDAITVRAGVEVGVGVKTGAVGCGGMGVAVRGFVGVGV